MVYSLSKFKYFQVMWYIICQNTRIKTKITFCYIPHFSLIFCMVLIAYDVHNIMPCRGERQYLLTLQVSRYCFLAMHISIILWHIFREKADFVEQPASGITKPTHLKFNLSPNVLESIEVAKQKMDKWVGDWRRKFMPSLIYTIQ